MVLSHPEPTVERICQAAQQLSDRSKKSMVAGPKLLRFQVTFFFFFFEKKLCRSRANVSHDIKKKLGLFIFKVGGELA